MKPVISPEYAAMNRQLHKEREDYGASAAGMAEQVVRFARDNSLEVILDYGCGKGALKPAVKRLAPRLRVLEYDPAIPNKDRLPSRRPDLIVALDVMEHIEPEFLDAVLQTMHGLQPKGVYFMISLEPASKTLPDGRNAHLIVKTAEWWRERLGAYFRTTFEKDEHTHYRFIGIPLARGMQ